MKNNIKLLKKLNAFLMENNYIKEAESIRYLIKQAQSVYTIKSGDTFDKIGKGDPQYIQAIKDANPGVDPGKLQIGQKIKLPPPPYRPNEDLQPSSLIIDFIKREEGDFESEPYQDHQGNWTIGYGHKLEAGQVLKYKLDPLTEAEGEKFFAKDIEVAASFVRRNITVPLTQNQFDALVSIIFNIGTGSFFESSVYQALEKEKNLQKTKTLISSMVSVGDRGTGVPQRRSRESQIFGLR